MKMIITGLGLALFLGVPTTYAGDCSVSFDQSCLATRYNRSQVENDFAAKEAHELAALEAAQAQQRQERKEAMERWSYESAARRQQQTEAAQIYRDGAAERFQGYRERLQAIQTESKKPTESFLDRRPLHVR